MQLTRHLRITGRVQGVGYRDAMAVEAARLGIGGWVRNRSDGSVEAVIAGEEEGLQRLVDWARRGPPAARVDEIVSTEMTNSPAPGRFERRPTV